MKLKNLLKSSFLIAALTFAAPVHSQGVPTIDTTSIAQLIQQVTTLQNQYETQLNQFAQLQEQYALLTQQYEAISGLTELDMSSILPAFDVDMPNIDVSGAINNAKDGVFSGDLGALIENTLSTFSIPNLSDAANDDLEKTRVAAQLASVAASAIALGETGLTQAGEVADRATRMADGVGSQDTLKQAVDYNSAIQAEIAQNQARIIQLLSVQALNSGTTDLANIRRNVVHPNFLNTNVE